MPDSSSNGAPQQIDVDPAIYRRKFHDENILALEHERFGPRLWHLLGMADEFQQDGDWFTATIAGRSVFVQRFGETIASFENVCAHRFYPLRTEASGNGPIRCGFHGWMYNRRGEAVGIPMCEELYGRTRRELDRRLRPIEIELCGNLIFGRLPPPEGEPAPSLADYLGTAAIPIATLSTQYPRLIGNFEQTIKANWKLCYHLTLDDYHLATVHPDTFGANGLLKDGEYRYFDLGRHSALFVDGAGVTEDAFERFATECAEDVVSRHAYRIIQLFPYANIFLCPLEDAWFVGVTEYRPIGPAETLGRFRLYRTADEGEATARPDMADRITALIRQVADEDRVAAERLQRSVGQIWREPALSRQEERIAWFDAAYAATMGST